MSYLTDEARKAPLNFTEEYFRFVSKVDLSGGIDVYPISNTFKLKPKDPRYRAALARDVAVFIGHFMIFTHPYLNGFSGLDCFEWRFHEEPYEE